MAMTKPQNIPMPWASEGQLENIPADNAASGRATWKIGFPPETAIPRQSGGIPPNRMDFQGVFNALSSHAFFQQSGCMYTWDNSLDYLKGAHILGSNGKEYIAQKNSGPSYGGAKNPTTDTTYEYWKSQDLIWADKIYPVGSIYLSMTSTNPQLLFGGVWKQLGGRFLIGADNSFVAGSTGGSRNHTLTVGEMPIHTHSASVSEVGNHTHTTTVSAVAAHEHPVSVSDSGSHTHKATVESVANHTHSATVGNAGSHNHSATTAKNGDHAHTRGTMEITGVIPTAARFHKDWATGAFAYQKDGEQDGDTSGDFGGVFDFYASRSWTGSTSSTGGHTHSLSTDEKGAHTHTVSISAAGAHTHTVTNASDGKHSHDASSAKAGAHSHTVTLAANGKHSHTVTNANAGGGSAFSILPPYLACYMWQRTA